MDAEFMRLKQIKSLSECNFGKYFLMKSYSIELLLYLLEFKEALGMEDFLCELKSATPKMPAFIAYISLLEEKGCILKSINKAKGSKRTIALTLECENAIRQYLA